MNETTIVVDPISVPQGRVHLDNQFRTMMEYSVASPTPAEKKHRARPKSRSYFQKPTPAEQETALWLSLTNEENARSSCQCFHDTCCASSCFAPSPVSPSSPPPQKKNRAADTEQRRLTTTPTCNASTRQLLLKEARKCVADGKTADAISHYLDYLQGTLSVALPSNQEKTSSHQPGCPQSQNDRQHDPAVARHTDEGAAGITSLWRYMLCWHSVKPQNRNVRALIAAYDASSATPEDATVWDALGVLYFETGHYAEADACYLMALKLKSNSAEVLYHRGVLLQALGLTLAALEAFEAAVRLSTTSDVQRPFIPALFSLGTLRLELNRLDEALRDFEIILEYDHTNTAVLVLMADCLERQHRFSAAARALEKARLLDPNDFAIKRAINQLSLRVARDSRWSDCRYDERRYSSSFTDDDRLTTQCPSDLEGLL